MSETAKYLHLTQPYCRGNVIDVGSQGSPVVPHAFQIDLPAEAFSKYSGGNQIPAAIWQGDARDLPFKDGTVDTVYSSHLLEDFDPWWPLLKEWIRVLKVGGVLIVLMPDNQLWDEAVARGQPPNCAHQRCGKVGALTAEVLSIHPFIVMEDRLTLCHPGDYTIMFVGQKL